MECQWFFAIKRILFESPVPGCHWLIPSQQLDSLWRTVANTFAIATVAVCKTFLDSFRNGPERTLPDRSTIEYYRRMTYFYVTSAVSHCQVIHPTSAANFKDGFEQKTVSFHISRNKRPYRKGSQLQKSVDGLNCVHDKCKSKELRQFFQTAVPCRIYIFFIMRTSILRIN